MLWLPYVEQVLWLRALVDDCSYTTPPSTTWVEHYDEPLLVSTDVTGMDPSLLVLSLHSVTTVEGSTIPSPPTDMKDPTTFVTPLSKAGIPFIVML